MISPLVQCTHGQESRIGGTWINKNDFDDDEDGNDDDGGDIEVVPSPMLDQKLILSHPKGAAFVSGNVRFSVEPFFIQGVKDFSSEW